MRLFARGCAERDGSCGLLEKLRDMSGDSFDVAGRVEPSGAFVSDNLASRGRIGNDDRQTGRILDSADHLGEHMGEAPAIIVPAGRQADPGSVFPGVQNLFLAARALGLGDF